MKIHPAADLFPMMRDEEIESLSADIAENGLRDPIVLLDGQVLDGRNRLRACAEAGVEPRFEEYDGDAPFSYVVSTNLHRRHLTQSQMAAIAADAREPLMEEAKKRSSAAAHAARWGCGNEYGEDAMGPKDPIAPRDPDEGRSRAIVARQFGVGHMQVGRAWKVRENDSELFERIKSGEVTVGAAYAAVTEGKPIGERKQTAIYFGKGDRWKEATEPILRYLAGQKSRGNTFPHLNPREAAKRVATIDGLILSLQTIREDIEPRSHVGRLTA